LTAEPVGAADDQGSVAQFTATGPRQVG